MDEIYELYEHCTTKNTIMCNKCRTIGREMDCEPYDAANTWSRKGWRITKHQTIYCPKCAEAKLKPNGLYMKRCKPKNNKQAQRIELLINLKKDH